MGSSAMGMKSKTSSPRKNSRTQPLKGFVHVRQSTSIPLSLLSLPRIPSWSDELLLTWETLSGPTCKKMNDISPNAIFLSSAFEPTPEEVRAFARSEKERSRAGKEKKPVLLVPSTSTDKVARRSPPPPETFELSSDEDMPDFKDILGRSKKEVSFLSIGKYKTDPVFHTCRRNHVGPRHSSKIAPMMTARTTK